MAALAMASVFGLAGGVSSQAFTGDNILPKDDDTIKSAVEKGDGYFYGVTGGNVYLDNGTKGLVGEVNGILNYDSDADTNTDPVTKILKSVAFNVIKSKMPSGIAPSVGAVNDKTLSGTDVSLTGDIDRTLIGVTTESGEKADWVRYYGAVGGDLVVNAGMSGQLNVGVTIQSKDDEYTLVDIDKTFSKEDDTVAVDRTGNINLQVGNDDSSVSVIGGMSGMGAVSVGNITADIPEASKDVPSLGVHITVGEGTLEMNGDTTTALHGNVNTKFHQDANVVGWTNGGLAGAIGGKASNTVTGNTALTIDGTNRRTDIGLEGNQSTDKLPQLTHGLDMMKDSSVNAIGVVGGGTAVTTLGGEATNTVEGSSNITVNNATVIGVVGGGAAASVDATGAAEAIIDPDAQYGKNNGNVDVNGKQLEDMLGKSGIIPDKLTVTATNAVDGGTATSKVENDTNISITGTSTAAGVLGGGAAVASHTYTIRPDTDGAGPVPTDKGYSVNDEYGYSRATATTGRSHITINLEKQLAKWGADKEHKDPTVTGKDEMLGAVKNFAEQLTNPSSPITPEVLKDFSNKGAAIGVFGGGAAIAQSGNRQHLSNDANGNADQPLSETDGAFATAATDGSDINLLDGYIVGVMGGGVAGAINNSTANAEMTDTVNITIGGNYSVRDENGKPATKEGSPEVVGVFGNGLAYFTGSTATPGDANGDGIVEDDMNHDGEKGDVETVFAHLKGTATASAKDTNITVLGKDTSVDGIIGGGMAIDDSDAERTNAIAETSGKVTINVVDGTINKAEALSGLAEMGLGDLGTYAGGVNDAAGNAAIAAGGIALGGGAKAYVNEAEVNIAGGIVDGDIYGGGIAAYGYANNVDGESRTDGSHVGTSIINLHGSVKEDGSNTTTITGNVYAGGAVSTVDNRTNHQTDRYESANATVDNATVNLAGAQVNGILYGTGTVNQKVLEETDAAAAQAAVGDSTLNLLGENTLSTVKDETERTESSKIQAYNHVTATSGSRTTLTGISAENTVAIIDGGEGKVESGAYADVNAFKDNGTYHVGDNMTGSLWQDDALIYDRMNGRYAEINTGDGTDYDIVFKDIETEEEAKKAADSMSDALDAGSASNLIQQGMSDGWRNISGGAREYFDDWQNHQDSNAAFRRGMMIGEDAAVTGNTVSIARDMADNVMQRLSFTDDYVQDNGWVNNDGGIWAKYIHRKYETDNMGSSVGGIHSSTDYDGAIVGVDFAKHGNFQSGVAFHYGSGDGNGLISRNDYDAWGFTLYGSLKDEEAGTNLMADIGYVTSDNDIDGTVAGKSLSADRDVDAWTIGLRGEKEYVFGQNQLVPYVGLRYMSVNPGAYSMYYDGKRAFDYDADNQSLWLLPVGVSFRNETVTGNGWRITPKLDLSYIWAFGDTDTDMTVNAGTYSTALYYDVMDDNSWLASLGVEATKDVWSFGVGYGYQKGDDTKNKTWFVNASYAF